MTPYNVLPGMMPGVLAGLFLLVMIVSILILVIVGMTHAERRYLASSVLLTLGPGLLLHLWLCLGSCPGRFSQQALWELQRRKAFFYTAC